MDGMRSGEAQGRKSVGDDWPYAPKPGQSRIDSACPSRQSTRAWPSGQALAFQASYTGSIPVARSNVIRSSHHLWGVGMSTDPATEVALKLVKEFEGCKLKAYPDPGTGAEPYTIGWGSTGPGIKPGVIWTQQQADDRLAADVKKFGDSVKDSVTYPANPNQMGAMISLAYNIGLAAFRSSTLLRKLNAGDVRGAQEQFGRWNRAGGKVMRGLTRRRNAEAKVFGS